LVHGVWIAFIKTRIILGKEHQKRFNMMENNVYLGTDGKKMLRTQMIFR